MSIKTGTWLPMEDTRLREAVARNGTRWVLVASEVGSRTGDQCAKRWNENLNPELDHSPWTTEEDERLLAMVNTYGRNWKSVADTFFELRAPLALKNRYSLLMRRLSRHASGGQHSPSTKPARQSRTVRSLPCSGSTTPLYGSNVDLTSLFGGRGDGGFPSPSTDYFGMARSDSSNYALSPGLFSPNSISSDDLMPYDVQRGASSIGGNHGGGDTASLTIGPLASPDRWDDQGTIWQQPLFYTKNTMETDCISSSPTVNGGAHGLDQTNLTFNSGSNSQHMSPSEEELRPRNITNPGGRDSTEIEYSITCQRGKLKAAVGHLINAALSESAGRSSEDAQTTLTLRLKS